MQTTKRTIITLEPGDEIEVVAAQPIENGTNGAVIIRHGGEGERAVLQMDTRDLVNVSGRMTSQHPPEVEDDDTESEYDGASIVIN